MAVSEEHLWGKKRLALNLTSNVVSLLVSLTISFILTPYLIASIGKEAYAFYPISTNFISYMMIITIALNSMVARFITIEIIRKNEQKAQMYFSSVFIANCILVGILIIPLVLLIIYLDSFLNIPPDLLFDIRLLFTFVFGAMLVNLMTSVYGVSTFAKNRLELFSAKEIFQGVFKALLLLGLYSIFQPSLVFIGIAAFALSISNFLIERLITKKLLPHMTISIRLFNLKYIKELIYSGIWNSVSSLGNVLIFSVSLIIANIFISATASGELAITQVLPRLLISIITMLVAVFMPRLTNFYAQRLQDSLIYELKFSQKVMSLFTTVPVVLIIIFGQDFFGLWVPAEDALKLQLLSVVSILSMVIHGNMWSLTGLNVVINKIKIPSIVLIGVGLLNISISYIFLKYITKEVIIIPIINLILNVLYYLFFIPIYASIQLKISKTTFYITIIRSFITVTVLIVLGFLIQERIAINSWIDLLVAIVLYGLFGLMIHSILILSRNDFSKIFGIIRERFLKRRFHSES